MMVRVFANGRRDRGSIPRRVIPMTLDASLLNTQHYKIWIKWSNPWKVVVPPAKPWCCSYRKVNLRVALDYGRQLYLYIYWQHFFKDTYLIVHKRHFFVYIFFVNPFELPYRYYDIRRELVDKLFIISYFLSICPTLGHHQG